MVTTRHDQVCSLIFFSFITKNQESSPISDVTEMKTLKEIFPITRRENTNVWDLGKSR